MRRGSNGSTSRTSSGGRGSDDEIIHVVDSDEIGLTSSPNSGNRRHVMGGSFHGHYGSEDRATLKPAPFNRSASVGRPARNDTSYGLFVQGAELSLKSHAISCPSPSPDGVEHTASWSCVRSCPPQPPYYRVTRHASDIGMATPIQTSQVKKERKISNKGAKSKKSKSKGDSSPLAPQVKAMQTAEEQYVENKMQTAEEETVKMRESTVSVSSKSSRHSPNSKKKSSHSSSESTYEDLNLSYIRLDGTPPSVHSTKTWKKDKSTYDVQDSHSRAASTTAKKNRRSNNTTTNRRASTSSKRSVLSSFKRSFKKIFRISPKKERRSNTNETAPVDILNIPVENSTKDAGSGSIKSICYSDESLTGGTSKKRDAFSGQEQDTPLSVLSMPDLSQSDSKSLQINIKRKSKVYKNKSENGGEVYDMPWNNGIVYGTYSGPIDESLNPHGKGIIKIKGIWEHGELLTPEALTMEGRTEKETCVNTPSCPRNSHDKSTQPSGKTAASALRRRSSSIGSKTCLSSPETKASKNTRHDVSSLKKDGTFHTESAALHASENLDTSSRCPSLPETKASKDSYRRGKMLKRQTNSRFREDKSVCEESRCSSQTSSRFKEDKSVCEEGKRQSRSPFQEDKSERSSEAYTDSTFTKPKWNYCIGQASRQLSDMVIHRYNFDAIDSVSMIEIMQQAFVKRSNGLWTCAVLVERGMQPINCKRWYQEWEINYDEMQVEESMLFVINNDGSTKIIQKRNWGKFIRRLNVREFEDASNIEEDNAHFDTIPETEAFSGTTEDMTNDDTNIADDDNPQPPGKCEEVHDEDTDIISKSEEDERESEDAGNIAIQETEDNPQPPGTSLKPVF